MDISLDFHGKKNICSNFDPPQLKLWLCSCFPRFHINEGKHETKKKVIVIYQVN